MSATGTAKRIAIRVLTHSAITTGTLTCSCSASTSIQGGEARFDAAPPLAPTDGGDHGSGDTWVDLYRDFFGPSGRASCAGDGRCHGALDQPGAKASGYVCASGRDECYAGIVNGKTKLVVVGNTTTPAKDTLLHQILRKSDGKGIMPKRPEFVFTDADMARIDAWIRRGAPDDAPIPQSSTLSPD